MRSKRSERLEFRLSEDERETLNRLGEVLGKRELAEFVRRVSLLAANNVLQLKSGAISESFAMAQYAGLLLNYVSLKELNQSRTGYEVSIREITPDEDPRRGAP